MKCLQNTKQMFFTKYFVTLHPSCQLGQCSRLVSLPPCGTAQLVLVVSGVLVLAGVLCLLISVFIFKLVSVQLVFPVLSLYSDFCFLFQIVCLPSSDHWFSFLSFLFYQHYQPVRVCWIAFCQPCVFATWSFSHTYFKTINIKPTINCIKSWLNSFCSCWSPGQPATDGCIYLICYLIFPELLHSNTWGPEKM